MFAQTAEYFLLMELIDQDMKNALISKAARMECGR